LLFYSAVEYINSRTTQKEYGSNNLKGTEIEVVELFDDEGQSMLFELLTTIEEDGGKYFLLTAYDSEEAEINMESPADVFIMQEVERNGGKMLEPLEDRMIMEKVFNKFKEMNSTQFDFVE
jgi:uncharacterized protein YrzB (UPF0473 family)